MFRIRIIPATIFTAILLLCLKVIDISNSAEALAQAGSAATPAAGASGGTPSADKSAAPKEGDAPAVNPAISDSAGGTVDSRYTAVEVDLLQNLTKRREELDRWEKNIEIKEQALNATEKRVDSKIAQIESMKKEVSALLAQYNEKEDVKIHSLVKIYQGMKAKDAARIFDELDMPVLLLVVDKMPEKNTAPILALMDPKKAKQVTVQLAEQRKIGTNKVGETSPLPIPPSTGR